MTAAENKYLAMKQRKQLAQCLSILYMYNICMYTDIHFLTPISVTLQYCMHDYLNDLNTTSMAP